MGLTPLITWAVLDSVMRVVITETQGSSVVETRARALRLVMLGADLEFCIWDAGFKLCVLAASNPASWHWKDGGAQASSLASWYLHKWL